MQAPENTKIPCLLHIAPACRQAGVAWRATPMKKIFTNKVMRYWRSASSRDYSGESSQLRLERAISTVRRNDFKPRRGVSSLALGDRREPRVQRAKIQRSSGGATPASLRTYTPREAFLPAGRHRRLDDTNMLGVAPLGLRMVGCGLLTQPYGRPGLSKTSSLRDSVRRGR